MYINVFFSSAFYFIMVVLFAVQTKCAGYVCLHGGTCVNGPQGYKCVCKEPYTGNHCLGKLRFKTK